MRGFQKKLRIFYFRLFTVLRRFPYSKKQNRKDTAKMKTVFFKKALSVFLVLTMFIALIPANSVIIEKVGTTAEAAGGVAARIQEILSVYPHGSYFTTDGKSYASAQGYNCTLSNIPARGGLSSGAEAARVCGDGSSCNAFA